MTTVNKYVSDAFEAVVKTGDGDSDVTVNSPGSMVAEVTAVNLRVPNRKCCSGTTVGQWGQYVWITTVRFADLLNLFINGTDSRKFYGNCFESRTPRKPSLIYERFLFKSFFKM